MQGGFFVKLPSRYNIQKLDSRHELSFNGLKFNLNKDNSFENVEYMYRCFVIITRIIKI